VLISRASEDRVWCKTTPAPSPAAADSIAIVGIIFTIYILIETIGFISIIAARY